MLAERANSFTRRSLKTTTKVAGLKLAVSMVDLTTLEGADSPQKVHALCRKAMQPALDDQLDCPAVAAVCVYPLLVSVAREALADSSVKVASVATGFPSGQFPIEVRLADTEQAIDAGADEIDMVINRGAYLAGQRDVVMDEISAVWKICQAADPAVHLKIILETGELGSYDAIRHASDIAIEAVASCGNFQDGEVFLKTSTGKVNPAATMPTTLVMLEAIRDFYRATNIKVGMKPAGGIRTAKTALHYLAMVNETLGRDWLTPTLFRFGASSLLNDLLRQLQKQATGVYPAVDDFANA